MYLSERFDVGVCMETLEHVADLMVDGYIDALATVVRRRLDVTIPNEKRLPFLVKYVYHVFKGGGERYTPGEVVNAALGRMNRVARDGHKGFDYQEMILMPGTPVRDRQRGRKPVVGVCRHVSAPVCRSSRVRGFIIYLYIKKKKWGTRSSGILAGLY